MLSSQEYYDSIHHYTGVIDRAAQLEAQGWKIWLMSLFPFWFSEDFSQEHIRYWELRWSVLHRIKAGEAIPNKELVAMLILGRGLGKSSVIEAGRIMRGAILGTGYSLIISETDDQAQEHLGNCRILIEHPDSALTMYYPGMAITDNADAVKGMPTSDRKEMFICKNGYICRAKGLSAKMRGLRVGVQRPDDIALDDIDDVNDSLMVSQNKLRLITASILPVQARENVTVDVGQNLISEHSVVNQILSGKSDALADRTVIGVANAFTTLDIESKFDETGRMRHIIKDTSIPSWKGLNVERAQKFLDNSGLQTFYAEYQNKFDQYRSGRVIPNYNEEAQVITWSQFEAVFGERRIPRHWQAMAGLDVGYSEGQYPHYSAWVFMATAAMNSGMPGALFIYRGRSFIGTSIDDQATKIKAEMYPDERILAWQMSHERTGEMLTLQQKYHLPFYKFRHYKAEDGVAQWKHMSISDHTKPNPFKDDDFIDGEYRIGRPSLYYLVDDEQLRMPIDDAGLRIMREQISTWEYVPVKLTESGQTIQRPSKVNDDFCFVAGTKIKTLLGEKNIEDVTTEDFTLTRKGYRRVLASALTNPNADILTLHLSDGRKLSGTANHPVFIEGKGFIQMRHIQNDDRILSIWQSPKRSYFKASRSIATPNQQTDRIGATFRPTTQAGNWDSLLTTSQYGNQLTERFRLGTMSTTRTRTRLITTSPTLNWYLAPSITDTIWRRRHLIITQNSTHHWIRPESLLKSGIEATTGGNGTVKRLRPRGRIVSLWIAFVDTARTLINRGTVRLNSVLQGAAVGSGQQAVPRFERLARNVLNHSASPRRQINSAPQDADKPRIAFTVGSDSATETPKVSSAVRVVRISTGERQPVYNLTVDDAHEYFANGVLVHNCDVIKSLIAYFGAGATEFTKEEKIIARMPEKIAAIGEDATDSEKVQRNLWMQQQWKNEQQAEKRKAVGNMGSALNAFSKNRGKF